MDSTTKAATPDTTGIRVENHERGGGGVLVGEPYQLSAIARWFGFRNAAANGRLFLTGPKIRRLFPEGVPSAEVIS